MRRWWKRKQVTPQWSDPLNPHGDGTLRPGDPVYDATMRGNAVSGEFGPEGWKFEETPLDVEEVKEERDV